MRRKLKASREVSLGMIVVDVYSRQITIIPKPEFRGFLGGFRSSIGLDILKLWMALSHRIHIPRQALVTSFTSQGKEA